MKKYFAHLRPLERRLVVGVIVVLIVVLNWWFIWPEFTDWGNYQRRLAAAEIKLKTYTAAVAEVPALQKQVSQYENKGEFVAPEDQGVDLLRTVQQQALQSTVALQDTRKPNTHTNDVFFIEQTENITVLAEEKNLVDFLYKLGSGPSMIRVRDLTLQPDPPHQRLSADIRLMASYQKSQTPAAAKTPTAKAK